MSEPLSKTEFMALVDETIEHLMSTKNLSAVRVADEMHVQAQRLRRIIKLTTGMNSTAYIANYKVMRAKQMLRDYDLLTVAKISYMLGYEEPTHFSRFFKRYTGMTPGEFRKRRDD